MAAGPAARLDRSNAASRGRKNREPIRTDGSHPLRARAWYAVRNFWKRYTREAASGAAGDLKSERDARRLKVRNDGCR
jgi:hypothetical protein